MLFMDWASQNEPKSKVVVSVIWFNWFSCTVWGLCWHHLFYMYIYIIIVMFYTSRAARGGGGSFKNRKPTGKIRCCESRNVFVGGNSKTATAVKNLDAITECEAHDYCFANCFQTCQEGPFSVDFTVCANLGIWPRSKTCTNCSTFQLTNGLVD